MFWFGFVLFVLYLFCTYCESGLGTEAGSRESPAAGSFKSTPDMAQKGGGREAEQMLTEECTLSANTDWVLPMCPQGAGGIIIMR